MTTPEYLDTKQIEAARQKVLPYRRWTEYGSKIPTDMMLRIAGRWYRVYAICWGTGTTRYVTVGGKRLLLETGWTQ